MVYHGGVLWFVNIYFDVDVDVLMVGELVYFDYEFVILSVLSYVGRLVWLFDFFSAPTTSTSTASASRNRIRSPY